MSGFDTHILIGDTHKHGCYTGEPTGDPNDRQLIAIEQMRNLAHPLGGSVGVPLSVQQLGDLKHEDFGPLGTFGDNFTHVFDGNHDMNDVRDYIVARFGSLTWGRKIGRCWFQAMTEDWTSVTVNYPPSVAQINGAVAASLAARPANEPTFMMVHRSLSTGGYINEWINGDIARSESPGASLLALDTLMASRNTLGIIHGHDHYSHHGTWVGPATGRSWRTISPGSVAQAPVAGPPPYDTTYPESIVVLRVADTWYDIASLVFGYNISRVWTPGVWEWYERISYYPDGSGLSVQDRRMVHSGIRGKKRVVYDVVFDLAYQTGGMTLDCSLDFTEVDSVIVEARNRGYMVATNPSTRAARYAAGKADLMVFRQNNTTGPLVQVPNGTDLSGLRAIIIVEGE